MVASKLSCSLAYPAKYTSYKVYIQVMSFHFQNYKRLRSLQKNIVPNVNLFCKPTLWFGIHIPWGYGAAAQPDLKVAIPACLLCW